MTKIVRWTKGMEEDLWDLHEEHPGWPSRRLAEEMGQPWKAVDNRLYKLKIERQEHWLEQARIAPFDIEASDLDANAGGYLLSWAVLMPDGSIAWDVITKKEIFNETLDRRLVKTCIDAILKVDVLVTYYGTGFDIPFLRARALYWGIPFPAYGQLQHIDLFFAARSLLKLSNKRMGTVTAFLGMTEKDHYDVAVWNSARLGNKEALEHIVQHNISDVEITRDLLIALGPYRRWTRNSI